LRGLLRLCLRHGLLLYDLHRLFLRLNLCCLGCALLRLRLFHRLLYRLLYRLRCGLLDLYRLCRKRLL